MPTYQMLLKLVHECGSRGKKRQTGIITKSFVDLKRTSKRIYRFFNFHVNFHKPRTMKEKKIGKTY